MTETLADGYSYVKSFPMNTNMTGFSKSFECLCIRQKKSQNSERVNDYMFYNSTQKACCLIYLSIYFKNRDSMNKYMYERNFLYVQTKILFFQLDTITESYSQIYAF